MLKLDKCNSRFEKSDIIIHHRADASAQFAYTARWRFCENIARGEAAMHLAEAALLIASEDDAIASHSTVPFPVESYLGRIQKLAEEFEQQRLRPMNAAAGGAEGRLAASVVMADLDDYLFHAQRFSVPGFGRSNLPSGALVDHPGVWEDAR